MLGVAGNAVAAEGFVFVHYNTNPSTNYAFYAYEYRYDTAQQKSLKCSSASWNSAPIVVSFGGADGTSTDAVDADLGRRLSNACVRLVAIQGANGYLTGAPAINLANKNMALDRVTTGGQNMGFAVNSVINLAYYSGASHVTVKGGSASGIYGAKVLEQRYGSLGTYPWTKVRRFVFGGPPTGDLTEACKYTADGSTTLQAAMTGHTGYATCKDYLNSRKTLAGTWWVYTATPLYTAFNGAQLTQLNNWGVKVNTFVGNRDEIFGYGVAGLNCATALNGSCWNGPQGVDNYLAGSGLTGSLGGVSRRTINDSRTAKFATATSNVTFTTMNNATHAITGPVANVGVCDVIAEGRSGANPAACYDPGRITGIIDSVQNNTIYGWACASGSPYSISVHVYVGGSAGVGTIIGGYAAANGSETAVANACGSFGTAYRFAIPLSLSVRQAHAGKRIYIHGIHPTGTYANDLLSNPGVFSVPAP
ncbi:MAG: hypothetical protein E6Q88_12160 [Lysobacteraceae bacterium]|nr:MAG: hypothetical protein E6Q88_12160 [Xanthomonadaceae bacterium]